MKAIQMSQFGGPEVLKIEEIKIGEPKKGEALIRIKAAGINFIDIYQSSKNKQPDKNGYLIRA